MRVLVTGHSGYIGTVLVPMLLDAGHDVVGQDVLLYDDCLYGTPEVSPPAARNLDIRDVQVDDLRGFDAVIHLAALSNDPMGNLNPECTYEINHRATVRLGAIAREAGVKRFLFSSSCSLYGAAGDEPLTEDRAEFNPVTPYGESKILAEQDLSKLADADFSPTFLRNATAYGYSSRLRGDLVVNNLVGYAMTTGEVLIKSDGTPWRPLIHIEDIALAFVAILQAPREVVHAKAYNVCMSSENYRVREVAQIVQQVVPNCRITYAAGAQPDKRNYRVNGDKLVADVPAFQPKWTVRRGVEQLYGAYRHIGLTLEDLEGPRLQRIEHVRALQASGHLDESLRWTVKRTPVSMVNS
jgi:nucleoside-diphosphate-sugar epimerase